MDRVTFSALAKDGSDADTQVAIVYDATMAYFRAVDFMIKNNMVTAAALNTTHLSGRMIKHIMAHNVSFVGVTGNVDFSAGRMGSKTYGYGDRGAGQGYVVFNFHNNATWGAFKRIGRWSEESLYLNCDAEPNPNGGYFVTPDWMGGCHLPMQTSMDDHVTLMRDRADDVIQRMPVALKVSLLFSQPSAHGMYFTHASFLVKHPILTLLLSFCHISPGLVFVPSFAVLLHGHLHRPHHLRRQASHPPSQGISTPHDDVHRGGLHAGIHPHLAVLFRPHEHCLPSQHLVWTHEFCIDFLRHGVEDMASA